MNSSKGHLSRQNAFVDVCVGPDNGVGVALSNDDMIKSGTPFGFLSVRRGDVWLEGGGTTWDAAAVATTQHPLNQYALIGPQGQAHFAGSGDRHVEQIADGAHSPKDCGLIRGARTIGGTVLACGMKKQVYRREDANRWVCISADIVGGPGVHGFEAIDGFAADDIYAAGWNGEIWRYDGSAWHQCDSPYGELLVDVCCAGDGRVYAIGRGQTLVVGRGYAWTARATELPVELSSLCWFQDKLYAASTRDIFVLDETGQFVPIAIPDDFPRTCGALATNGHILASAGERDLFTFDGAAWRRLD
jgi:hypothetical protein